MSARTAGLILVCGLGVGFAIGCKQGGGGGGSPAQAYINKLQACGLLSDGELPMLDENDIDDQASCFAECLLAASCEDLEIISCDPINGQPSEQLIGCYEDCFLEAEGEFTCTDGATIPADWECDDEPDCADGSDEQGCVDLECADGSGTYPEAYRCDGAPDCADGSDEDGCPGYVECADGNGSTPEQYLCDGFPDCADESDEQGCPFFACADGEMAVGGGRCDFDQDCEDGSDEAGCAQLVCPGP